MSEAQEIPAMGSGQKRQDMRARPLEMKGSTEDRLWRLVHIELKNFLFFVAFFFFFSYIKFKTLLYLSRSRKAVKL